MKRGGLPECEILHAKKLVQSEPENIWGWNTPAGQLRVKRRVKWIKKVCGLRPGIRALECGCGTGIFTRHLAATGAEITAVDISPDLLKLASRRCRYMNVKFVAANLEEPVDLEDEAYDAMYGVSVLHHLDVHKALKALARKLKPGGRFAFSEPNLLNPINRYIIFTDDLKRREKFGVSFSEMAFEYQEIREVFEGSGFIVKKVEYRDFLHPRLPVLAIPIILVVEYMAERCPFVQRISGSLWIHGVRA